MTPASDCKRKTYTCPSTENIALPYHDENGILAPHSVKKGNEVFFFRIKLLARDCKIIIKLTT